MIKIQPVTACFHLGMLLSIAMGCTSNQWNASRRDGNYITPEHFQFAEVVPEDVRGGWRAVCIRAQVGQTVADPQRPRSAQLVCGIEVGVPISNITQGYIGLRHAKEVSARIANEVAYTVLDQSAGMFSAEICRRIILGIDAQLKRQIFGSTATDCGVTRSNPGVPVVDWP